MCNYIGLRVPWLQLASFRCHCTVKTDLRHKRPRSWKQGFRSCFFCGFKYICWHFSLHKSVIILTIRWWTARSCMHLQLDMGVVTCWQNFGPFKRKSWPFCWQECDGPSNRWCMWACTQEYTDGWRWALGGTRECREALNRGLFVPYLKLWTRREGNVWARVPLFATRRRIMFKIRSLFYETWWRIFFDPYCSMHVLVCFFNNLSFWGQLSLVNWWWCRWCDGMDVHITRHVFGVRLRRHFVRIPRFVRGHLLCIHWYCLY